MKSRPLLFIACALVLFSPRLARAADGDHLLPGSALSIDKAVQQASLVVEAMVVDLGPTEPAASGQVTYRKATFKIYGFLKGKAESPIVARLTVMTQDGPNHESLPKQERHYILFVNNQGQESATSSANNPVIIKILPADPAHISQVNNIIAAASR